MCVLWLPKILDAKLFPLVNFAEDVVRLCNRLLFSSLIIC